MAEVCRYCNRHVNKLIQYLQTWGIPFLVPILTFFLVWAAFSQVDQIRQQRISADLAADRAKNAQCRTIDTGIETIGLIRGYLDDPAGKFMAVGSKEYRESLDEREEHLKNERQAVPCP
jgi:hypothetical protein